MNVVFKIGKKVVSLKQFRRHRLKIIPTGPRGHIAPAYSDVNPGKSTTMGCHSSEIGMMNDAIHQNGIVGVHYEPQRNRKGDVIGGKCVITNNSSKTGRRKWMQHYGKMMIGEPLRDQDAYYD